MGYNCAIYVEGVSGPEYRAFLTELEAEGVVDDVRFISFTDDETISIVEYDGGEFVGRYGDFPLDDRDGERLWLLFEFGSGGKADRICDFEEFQLLSNKLPKLDALRIDIEVATDHETGGGIYGHEAAYDPWEFDPDSVTGLPDREYR